LQASKDVNLSLARGVTAKQVEEEIVPLLAFIKHILEEQKEIVDRLPKRHCKSQA
jgi:hypothetical protein